MARWDIAETRRLIELRHGRDQLLHARNCLRAVTERQRHVEYHFREVKRLLKEHIDDRITAEKDIYAITWPTDEENAVALDDCLMKVEANMIAAVQAIHAIADNLAHVAYFALGINLTARKLADREVTMQRVTDTLASEPAYAAIVQALRALAADASFVRIGAITNVAKHRGTVEPRLSIEPADSDAPYVMEYGPFQYGKGGAKYPARELKDTLAPAYEAASRAVVDTGIAINEVLSR